jgi:hypothetical protein
MDDKYYINLDEYRLDMLKYDLQNRYLTPSRASLRERIPEKFALIEAQGITNLGQLIDALKTRKKLEVFSALSGLPVDYLVLLRREVNSYLPKPFDLKKVPEVDPQSLAKLESLGIKNTSQMFQRGRTRAGRAELEDQSGLSKAAVLEMVRLSDLARIWGVGPIFARILLEAGYDSVAGVAEASLEAMYEELNQLNRMKKYTPIMASLQEVGMCIEYAKILPKVVEY